MALTVLEAGVVFGPETAALQARWQAAHSSGKLVVPQLVGINLRPDWKPTGWYIKGLDTKAADIDPVHADRPSGERLFRPVACATEDDALRAIGSVAGREGVGVLIFRPLADESIAGQHRVLSALPDVQNVDGQVVDSDRHPQTTHVPATVKSGMHLLEHARADHGGLLGLETVAVIGDGPAVGRRTRQELSGFAHVTSITLEQNQELMGDLGRFDAVIAAAGAAEIIRPSDVRRKPGDRRPPLVLIDAAYEAVPGEKGPQGNLVRDFRDPAFQQSTDLVAVVAPLGVVSKGAQVEIFNNTFGVYDAQLGNYDPLAFSVQP